MSHAEIRSEPFILKVIENVNKHFSASPDAEVDLDTIVKQALIAAADLLPAEPTKPAAKTSSGAGSSARSESVYSRLMRTGKNADDDAAMDRAVGKVTISRDAKYTDKTAEKIAASDEDLFKTYDSVSLAAAALAPKFGQLITAAIILRNLSDEQMANAKKILKPAGAAPAVKPARAAPKTSSTDRKRGNNTIKTVLSAALSNTEMDDHLGALRSDPNFEGKTNGMTLGIALWKQLTDEERERWHSISHGIIDVKKAVSDRPEPFFELLRSNIDRLVT